ncbi:mitochondrial FMN-dependent NADH-azoreductase [Andalucia godoyi]|uniref:FMN-dependent NADH-azoreductase n=1 Tax=Andalucia godoyi TaxID=505711 RepID=A0A8K0F4A2_ANDGO|nr:mitochondrial FMN-dependent NADH-azoreductase [Andalucia godoyi]|eukprot:ANDGO_00649.mRNA.1 mitochondrial FMN-dependent NADH-azoreductase
MSRALVVRCIPRGDTSATGRILRAFLDSARPQFVETVDLCVDHPDFLTDPDKANAYAKRSWSGIPLTPEEGKALAKSDRYVAQIMRTDCVIIAYPVYNFSMPAVVKAWFDSVIIKGLTFDEGSDGRAKGLLVRQKAVLITVAGGHVSRSDHVDHSTALSTSLLNYIGIKQIHTIIAEDLDAQMERREALIQQAINNARIVGNIALAR